MYLKDIIFITDCQTMGKSEYIAYTKFCTSKKHDFKGFVILISCSNYSLRKLS